MRYDGMAWDVSVVHCLLPEQYCTVVVSFMAPFPVVNPFVRHTVIFNHMRIHLVSLEGATRGAWIYHMVGEVVVIVDGGGGAGGG